MTNFQVCGEKPIRELLEACGAVRYLRPIDSNKLVTRNERRKLRIEGGHEEMADIPGRIDNQEIFRVR